MPERQQRQLVGLVADDQRVAGVVAALEAHHHVGAAGEPVDDLALALVAPLGADDGDVTHENSPMVAARAALRGPHAERVQQSPGLQRCLNGARLCGAVAEHTSRTAIIAALIGNLLIAVTKGDRGVR